MYMCAECADRDRSIEREMYIYIYSKIFGACCESHKVKSKLNKKENQIFTISDGSTRGTPEIANDTNI